MQQGEAGTQEWIKQLGLVVVAAAAAVVVVVVAVVAAVEELASRNKIT